MKITSVALHCLNRVLQRFNLRLTSLTEERQEQTRLAQLAQTGHFQKQAFPLPPSFPKTPPTNLLEGLQTYAERFSDFVDPSDNQVNYTFNNPWFSSPDVEVQYTIVRQSQSETVVEIGSGNSTRIFRQAIVDGCLNTRLVSIDPSPRVTVEGLVDEFYRKRVEDLRPYSLFSSLHQNDILFIDSSHQIRTGNDVIFLFLEIIPALQPGVLIHIHDVFLPYDYPQSWILQKKWRWQEQYLLQTILMLSDVFEVVWAGHYWQQTWPDFETLFPFARGRPAQSLWLRKVK